MNIEWIILIAALIIIWLVIKAALKLIVISFNTAFQIFIILIVLRVFFTIMPQEVLQQIKAMPQLIRNLFLLIFLL
ncbi:hypothetical protein [Dactylococcopsis salina]|uniref:Uncharacterized protein n=1 Tax=Dactylococcopsis salina (strain PCC 8305) TaxID=13035 RepID=K9YTF1_DACS8|nr:hypothetical protein [Dactylococcopsis salina]AFZ49767.1 hypothetical protein Dacsa_1056 [Dactylococcopsis salina PCC 8305]